MRMKRSIFLTRSAVESNEPRRIARWVMRAKKRSAAHGRRPHAKHGHQTTPIRRFSMRPGPPHFI
jgi:hypothetical protein